MSDRTLILQHLHLLRQTFVLHLGRSRDGIDDAPGMNRGQNIPGSTIKELLIIGLHIKGDARHLRNKNDVCQIGLSMLDSISRVLTYQIHNINHYSSLTLSLGSKKPINRNS